MEKLEEINKKVEKCTIEIAEIKQQNKTIFQKLEKLDEKLFGNGQKGLVERVIINETTIKNTKKFVIIVISLALLAVAAFELIIHVVR